MAVSARAGDTGAVLACGAWLKNTACLMQNDHAQLSALNGDLDTADACQRLDQAVERLCRGADIGLVAHDLHPDFYSSRLAQVFAAQRGIETLAVQHHHAHIAAVCAEHRFDAPVLGLALDGVGLGTDGTVWGGELLRVDGADFRRLGHLAHLALPGGDRAARESWRMAAAVLHALGRNGEIAARFPAQTGAATVAAMLARGLNCPPTSSMGRLFDAAAGLLGVNEIQAYEAQAAIALQQLATKQRAVQHGAVAPLEQGWRIEENGVLDFGPLFSALADCRNAGQGAALFHATLAAGLAEWVGRAASAEQLTTVALGGGCFHNAILLDDLLARLTASGLQVLTTSQPGDAAISLGQAWVATQYLKGNRNVSGHTRTGGTTAAA